ncbi:MAG: DUF1934 domain-containing protein [Clostridia bacterium]|nr:DUF1934 domain-containing protein [Clostridia bacterium]
MKNAIVRITDTHIQNGEKARCELTSAGSFGIENGAYCIKYEETDNELSGCVTTLRIEAPNRISMLRSGKYNTEMVFETDRRHNCFYKTPFGEMMMGIYSKRVFSELDENGGSVNFAYTIDFNNDLVSENELKISVNVKEEQ